MRIVRRLLCLALAVMMIVSSGIPDVILSVAGNPERSKAAVVKNQEEAAVYIPNMPEEAGLDAVSYIMQNLNGALADKAAAYSEKKLKNIEEDPIVVNLGEGNLTTIDQVESPENNRENSEENSSSHPIKKIVSKLKSAVVGTEAEDMNEEKKLDVQSNTICKMDAVVEKDAIVSESIEKRDKNVNGNTNKEGETSSKTIEKEADSSTIEEKSEMDTKQVEEGEEPVSKSILDESDDRKAGEKKETDSRKIEKESETNSKTTEERNITDKSETVDSMGGLIPTVHSILINYSLADPAMVKDGVTTVSIWDDTPEAFLASYSSTATLYAIEGNNDCFVAFINPGLLNGRADGILDATFTNTDADDPVNYTNVVRLDKTTGIAYIPKSIYFNEKGEEIPYDLMTQVLVGYDMEQEYNGIHVTIENSSSDVKIAEEKQIIQGKSLDIKTTIPLTTPETAMNLDLEKVNLYVNGNAAPASFNSKEYYFDRETGELTVALAPVTLYSLRVVIEETTLMEKAEGIAQKLSNLMVIESFAQTTTQATSVSDIKVLPYGTIHVTAAVKEGQLFKKNVKMKYISDMSNASDAVKKAIYDVYEYCYYNYADNEYGRREYGYAKNGGTIQNYLDDPGFGHLEDSSENRTAFSLFNFFLKTPTGTTQSTTNKDAKMTFQIKTDIDYLVLHCCENITAADAIDSITPTGNWQDSELWFRVLALDNDRIILGICGPRCTTQAAYGVFAIKLDQRFALNLKIKKVSADSDFTDGNNSYSLAGAEYTLYEGFYGDETNGRAIRAWQDKKTLGIYKTNTGGELTIKDLEMNSPSFTYFIQETKAPKGFELDTTIYYVHTYIRNDALGYTISMSKDNGQSFHYPDYWDPDEKRHQLEEINNGGTMSQTSTEPLSSGYGQLLKTNSADTSKIVAGAEYQVYTDSSCKTKAKTLDGKNALFKTTDSGSNKLELAVGTYYVKETKAANDFELNDTVYTMKIEAGKTTTLGKKGTKSLSDVPYGKLTMKKESSDTNLTDGNSCYSLEGAIYEVYSDEKCTQEVGKLVTKADGSTNEISVAAGTYYVKEKTASSGYGLCDGTDGAKDGIHKVTVEAGKKATFTCKEPPLNDSFALKLQKKDADTGKPEAVGTASLEGALFEVCYWDNTEGKTDGDPFRKWVFRTDEKGKMYCFDESYLVAEISDELYKSPAGKIIYPLGTYTIKEIQPPRYYQLEGTMKFTNSAVSSDEVDIKDGLKIVIDDIDGKAQVICGGRIITAENLALDILEKVYKGKIKVVKYDTDGKSPLAGVSFKLVGDDGSEYTGTTNSNGEIVFEGLIPQHYVLTETSTVDGHTLLADNVDVNIPLEMTEEEAKDQNVDLSKAVWDEQAEAYCFYEVTYGVTNSIMPNVPTTGGTFGKLYAIMVIAFLMIGGSLYAILKKRKRV